MRTRLNALGRVTRPDGVTVSNIRAFVLDDHFLIFERNGQKVRLRESAIVTEEPITSKNQREHTVTTDQGVYVLTVTGCGCGSPLKKFGAGEAATFVTPVPQEESA